MPETPNNKDAWDRVTALATILVPAAIALAGHFIGQGLKQAEISSEERRVEQTQAIAVANTKIAQAGLINTMMKSLTSSNPQERKLAVQAVLIGLPEQGPTLVRTVAEFDQDKGVQATAKTSLDQRLTGLILNLFSKDSQERIGAAQDLIQGWRNDPNAVKALVDFASGNKGNSNGIYNTVVVLSAFSLSALEAHKEQVLEFAEIAKSTTDKAVALEKRFGG